MKPRDLLRYRGRPVRVYLYDGVAFEGVFQTEVLSESAVSVSLEHERSDVALTIDDIVDVLPPSMHRIQASV
jgi:ribosome maturation factor RimP